MWKKAMLLLTLVIALAFVLNLAACQKAPVQQQDKATAKTKEKAAGKDEKAAAEAKEGEPVKTAEAVDDSKVIAVVGQSSITVKDFNNIMERIPPFNRKRYATTEGKKELLDKLVEEELFYQEALRKGLDKDEEFVDRIQQIRRGILATMVKKDLYEADVEVPEEELKTYYDQNQDKFMTPEMVKVKLIMIRVKRNATEQEIAEAEGKAKQAQAALKAGTSWETVVEKYSEDRASKKKAGLLPKVRKGLRGEEFDAVAFNMKPGEISDVFRDKRGFNIIQFLEKEDAKLKEFEEVSKTIERRLKQDKIKTNMENQMGDLRSKTSVTVHEEVLEAIPVDMTGAEGPGMMPQMPPQAAGENQPPKPTVVPMTEDAEEDSGE